MEKIDQASDQPPDRAPGLGCTLAGDGAQFRVWAPNADRISVVGDFNHWDRDAHPMKRDDCGVWSASVHGVQAGHEYRYRICRGEQEFMRIDPRARCVTNSIGNGVVVTDQFDWQQDQFTLRAKNELVIYELHIGTFAAQRHTGQPATFDAAISKLDYLAKLGINCIEIMPVAEFAGAISWGYNPAHLFAVESDYGGPEALKRFIRAAHQHGIGVVIDVVYNHFGPTDLDLWQFDGWSENDLGGIYFYNDGRAHTPWGSTRPDYGRPEVRQFIHDNAMMWLNEYHADGLRYDMTLYIRHVSGDGNPMGEIPEGWSLVQWINGEIHSRYPGKLLIAEDLQNNEWMTRAASDNGAGFSAQWDAQFVHPVRECLTTQRDEDRNMDSVVAALQVRYNNDPFQRVVYTESHDEVANGKARIPTEVMPHASDDWFAVKRAGLGMALVLTAPGIPMLFQGQEFFEDNWFRDTEPLDWSKRGRYASLLQLQRDLIRLRLNHEGMSRGLMGPSVEILWTDNSSKVVAVRRWDQGGPADEVVVLYNFRHEPVSIDMQLPAGLNWDLVLNSDAKIYSEQFADTSPEVPQQGTQAHGGSLTIGPYAVLVYVARA